MATVFSKRLISFIEYQGLSIEAFERDCLVTQGAISKSIEDKTELSDAHLNKISRRHVEFNIDWLLTGDGQMIKSKSATLDTMLKHADEDLVFWKDLVATLKLALKGKNNTQGMIQ